MSEQSPKWYVPPRWLIWLMVFIAFLWAGAALGQLLNGTCA